MEIRKITEAEQISDIYHNRMKNDFPGAELKPLQSIQVAVRKHIYDCYGLFADKGQELLGYAFFIKKKAGDRYHYLLDYYAIAGEHRNEGLGSYFIEQFPEMITDADSVIIEVEDPDKACNEEDREIRNKRLDFYLRNNCSLTGITTHLFGVDYKILLFKDERKHDEEEIRNIYSDIYRSMVPALLYKQFVKIS